MKSNKVWFAEKQDGTIIELTELEALTHFESNNIAQRMRLKFLGTSDGSHFAEASKKVQDLLAEKRAEEIPDYLSLDKIGKARADHDLRMQYADEIKKFVEEGYKAEFEQAKQNGVERPNKGLRYITKGDLRPGDRNAVLSKLGGAMR